VRAGLVGGREACAVEISAPAVGCGESASRETCEERASVLRQGSPRSLSTPLHSLAKETKRNRQ